MCLYKSPTLRLSTELERSSRNLEYNNYHFSICTLEILVLCIVSYYSTLLNKYYLIIFVLLKIVKVRIDSEFVEYFILYLVKLQWTDIFNKFVRFSLEGQRFALRERMGNIEWRR